MDSEKKRNTIALIDSAKSGKSLDEILKQIKAARKLDQILLPRMGVMSNELLADMVGCSRAYVYGIMKGSKHPEKDMLLRIAFALGMGVDETQEMLKTAHRATLSSIDMRDICIIFGLVNGLDLETMDEVLNEKGQAPLSVATKEEERLYDILSYHLKEKNMSDKELIKRIKCSAALYEEIIEEFQFTPRDLLIRMAYVLKMKLPEVQVMLKLEKKPVLSVKDARDMFIMNGLANGMSPDGIEKMLKEQGQKPLWETFYDLPLSAEDD